MKKINEKKMDKKGISPMIGYVLLVVFMIIIGGIVFQWLRTFVPSQSLECPDGTSLEISEATFSSDTHRLTITLRNNGRFSVSGYFVHVTDNPDDELATINIVHYLNESHAGISDGTSVWFGSENVVSNLNPGAPTITHIFDINQSVIGNVSLVSIIPTRQQEVDGRTRFVSCSRSRTSSTVVFLMGMIVFISGQGRTYTGKEIGGVSGADAECNGMAQGAGFDGTFIAWISDDSTNAEERIPEEEYYVLVNRSIVANSKQELLSGNILSPINLDQQGIPRSGKVWTGTNEFGISTGNNCDNWSSDSASMIGTRGDINAINAGWTNFNNETCNDDSRIYCFQIE